MWSLARWTCEGGASWGRATGLVLGREVKCLQNHKNKSSCSTSGWPGWMRTLGISVNLLYLWALAGCLRRTLHRLTHMDANLHLINCDVAVLNRQITNGGVLTTEALVACEMSPISSSGMLGTNHFSSARWVLAGGGADSRRCHQSAADGFGDCVQIVQDNPLTLPCRFGVLARCRETTWVTAARVVIHELPSLQRGPKPGRWRWLMRPPHKAAGANWKQRSIRLHKARKRVSAWPRERRML